MGDEVTVKVGGNEKTLKVTGIYQDVTNGGKTAKAHTSLGVNEAAVLWYVVSMDVAPGVDKQVKMDYYQNAYESAQVNDIQEYTGQTLGNIIEQMRTVVIGGIIIAVNHWCFDHFLIFTNVIIQGYVSDCDYAKHRINL